MVNQDPVLFSGSIGENIGYGLADCSLDEIQEAARKANAHDFISHLEKAYDTGVYYESTILSADYQSVEQLHLLIMLLS